MTDQNNRAGKPHMGEVLVGIDYCPHCGVARPEMKRLWKSECIMPRGGSHYGHNWATYSCNTCKNVVLAQSSLGNQGTLDLLALYPCVETVDKELPDKAKTYLQQAIASLHAPDGASMLAGSAVDAMLKAKGLESGSVYSRIDEAVKQSILTREMGDWAHEVRLGSNRPRHADKEDPHVTHDEAKQSIEFTKTLGVVLFVLPSRVDNRGKTDAANQ